jgi:catechol 2,3-dioxygenase-like lactoylglutathione lyase family enzyme
MLGYVTIGTNDYERALGFYDQVLAGLGAKRAMGGERMQGYVGEGGGPMIMICKPYDGAMASNGNGTMFALAAPSREVVDSVHAAALAAGGSDEGAAGERMPGFYGAYFRDLDGNKFCVFKMG